MLEYLYTNPFLIFFIMLFCHIVDDYYLQGILASMKQKAWWKKQESYSEKYENSWVVALFMHAFSCFYDKLNFYRAWVKYKFYIFLYYHQLRNSHTYRPLKSKCKSD